MNRMLLMYVTTPQPPPSLPWWLLTSPRPLPSLFWPHLVQPATLWASTSPTAPSWPWPGSPRLQDRLKFSEDAFHCSMRSQDQREHGWMMLMPEFSMLLTLAKRATLSAPEIMLLSLLDGDKDLVHQTQSGFCKSFYITFCTKVVYNRGLLFFF